MRRQRRKMQPQTPCPLKTNPGDINIEIGRHTPEISEMTTTDVKKQIHQAIEEIISEMISQVKKEMTVIIKALPSISRESIDFFFKEEHRKVIKTLNE